MNSIKHLYYLLGGKCSTYSNGDNDASKAKI